MSVPEVTVVDVHRRMQNPAGEPFTLLDCRRTDELDICRLPSAVHISMTDLPTRFSELDPEREVVVYCRTGKRSLQVAAFLIQQGYRAASMHGGLHAWSAEIDPNVPAY